MKILTLGSHPDDIEHALGGTIFKLKDKHEILYICLSKCLDLPRNKNIIEEYSNVTKKLSNVQCIIYDFPNRKFPECAFTIREMLEKVKSEFNPDLVFTHSSYDIHQDHHTLYEETYRVFRNTSMLGFECIRSCPQFLSNFYIEITEDNLKNKVDILKLYKSQQLYYNREDTIKAKAVIRGNDIGKPFAEGFEVIRIIIKLNQNIL